MLPARRAAARGAVALSGCVGGNGSSRGSLPAATWAAQEIVGDAMRPSGLRARMGEAPRVVDDATGRLAGGARYTRASALAPAGAASLACGAAGTTTADGSVAKMAAGRAPGGATALAGAADGSAAAPVTSTAAPASGAATGVLVPPTWLSLGAEGPAPEAEPSSEAPAPAATIVAIAAATTSDTTGSAPMADGAASTARAASPAGSSVCDTAACAGC